MLNAAVPQLPLCPWSKPFNDNSTLNGKIHQMLVEIRKKKSVQLYSELGKEPDFTEKCCHPRMTTGALQTENRKEQGRVHHPLSQAAPLPVRSLYGQWKESNSGQEHNWDALKCPLDKLCSPMTEGA